MRAAGAARASASGCSSRFDWRDPRVAQVLQADAAGDDRRSGSSTSTCSSTRSSARSSPSRRRARSTRRSASTCCPQGIFSVAIATILFPTLVALRRARRPRRPARARWRNGMRQIVAAADPGGRDQAVLAEPITRLVYQRGAFGAASTDLVSEALFWFSFSLPFAGVNLLLTRTFFSSSGRGCRPRSRSVNLVVNVAVSLALYKPLGIAGLVHRHRRRARRDGARAGRTACGASSRARGPADAARRGADAGRRRGCSAASPTAVWYGARRRRSAASLVAQIVRVGGRRSSPGIVVYVARRCSRCASRRRARSRRLIAAPVGRSCARRRDALTWRAAWPTRPTSATSRSSPTSTMGSRRWPTASSRSTHTVDPRNDARADARLDGPRARARDHDQGPGGARRSTRRATARPTSCT